MYNIILLLQEKNNLNLNESDFSKWSHMNENDRKTHTSILLQNLLPKMFFIYNKISYKHTGTFL